MNPNAHGGNGSCRRDALETITHKHKDGSRCVYRFALHFTRYEIDRTELGIPAAVALHKSAPLQEGDEDR